MKYVFVGNRKFVLEEMIRQNLSIQHIFVIANTHLQRDIKELTNTSFSFVSSKKELLAGLEEVEYDCLISNGCPFILPVDKMKSAKYINIHPSYLPDLRGVDPVVGAMLFQRDFGATCHYMDSGIDTGDMIQRVKIPLTNDLDIALAYQLSFRAEKEAFNLALEANFEVSQAQKDIGNEIYYKRSPKDQSITFEESNQEILSKIRAFSNLSQGAYFKAGGKDLKCHGAIILTNDYVKNAMSSLENLEVFLVYEDVIIFKKDDEVIKLCNVKGDLSELAVHSKMGA